MKILVTGGAGYIGSFMTRRLLDDNHTVSVVDNLSRGHQAYIDSRVTFLQGDLLDENFVNSIFVDQPFDGVIHFAGYISVGESMQQPSDYFKNNVDSVINLLEGMKKNKSSNFIFSSTAAVYGNPEIVPIPEDHKKSPGSPYGESKLMAEKVLYWYRKQAEINYMCLRYFNASGAALDGSHGENHDPETHIIPRAMRAALLDESFSLFGDDYKTEDGTCVRDYIHVLDLVEAHMLGLEKLQKDAGGYQYNVGTGKGYSNKEICEMVKKVTGKNFDVQIKERREGDPDKLIADASSITKELGFSPKYSDLQTIIESAYKWHKSQQ